MSSGPEVFGRMMPWKRFGAPRTIASMSPRKNFEWMLFGPDGDDLLAEVEGVERLDHHRAALRTLELVRAGVLEVRHDVVDRGLHRVGRVLVELHVVPRVRHLGARDDEALSSIEYEHAAKPF